MGSYNEVPPTWKKVKVETNGFIRYGFQNESSDWVVLPMFDELKEFDDWESCPAKLNSKWGIINSQGHWVINPAFDELEHAFDIFSWNLSAKLNEKWGLIDPHGNWIINPIFDMLEWSEGDYYKIEINGKFGFINEQAKYIVDPIYDDLFRTFDIKGYCGAKLNDKWGFINRQGEWIIKPFFDEIYNKTNLFEFLIFTPGFREDDHCRAKINGLWGFINRQGQWIIKPMFDNLDIKFDKEGNCGAVLNGKNGFINRQGDWFYSPESTDDDIQVPEDNEIFSLAPEIKEENDSLSELDKLIGLESVKGEIKSIFNFITVQKQRLVSGLRVSPVSYHCVFTGSPGTGKTTTARIIASVYKDLGVLKKGHLVETDRSGLVAEYLGQTAVKVNNIVDSALDGILFIDEAYSIVGTNNDDFGKEAVATLIKRIEDNRDRLVVIMAGYKEEMDLFINSNPGFQSRFNRYINFDDYAPDELMSIFKVLCKNQDYKLTEPAEIKLLEIITTDYTQRDKSFGNGRYVRNLFEKTIKKQSDRIVTLTNKSKETFSSIEEGDLES